MEANVKTKMITIDRTRESFVFRNAVANVVELIDHNTCPEAKDQFSEDEIEAARIFLDTHKVNRPVPYEMPYGIARVALFGIYKTPGTGEPQARHIRHNLGIQLTKCLNPPVEQQQNSESVPDVV